MVPNIKNKVLNMIVIIFMLVFNVINVLIKQAVKSPDTDISTLVNEARSQKYTSVLNSRLKFIMVILIGVILPTMFFFKPKILYHSNLTTSIFFVI